MARLDALKMADGEHEGGNAGGVGHTRSLARPRANVDDVRCVSDSPRRTHPPAAYACLSTASTRLLSAASGHFPARPLSLRRASPGTHVAPTGSSSWSARGSGGSSCPWTRPKRRGQPRGMASPRYPRVRTAEQRLLKAPPCEDACSSCSSSPVGRPQRTKRPPSHPSMRPPT